MPPNAEISGPSNDTLLLKHETESVSYTIHDGRITRRPGLNLSDAEYTWHLPNVKFETHLWSQDNEAYAVELTAWNQQTVLGREQKRFKQTSVFFRKGRLR